MIPASSTPSGTSTRRTSPTCASTSGFPTNHQNTEYRMIVVTGGAGFIGSAIVWGLNRRGEKDILVVDRLDEPGPPDGELNDKRRNLAPLAYADYLDADDFLDRIARGGWETGVRAPLPTGALSRPPQPNAHPFCPPHTPNTR